MKTMNRALVLLSVLLCAQTVRSNPVITQTGATPDSTVAAQPPAQRDYRPMAQGPVNDVLRMLDAGVDGTVVREYIRTSPVPFNLNATEIIAMKDKGIPSDIITGMLQRSGELRGTSTGAPVAPSSGESAAAPSYAAGGVPMVNQEPLDQPPYPYYPDAYPLYTYPAYSYSAWYGCGYPWPYFWPYFSFGFYPCYHGYPYCDYHHDHHDDHGHHDHYAHHNDGHNNNNNGGHAHFDTASSHMNGSQVHASQAGNVVNHVPASSARSASSSTVANHSIAANHANNLQRSTASTSGTHATAMANRASYSHGGLSSRSFSGSSFYHSTGGSATFHSASVGSAYHSSMAAYHGGGGMAYHGGGGTAFHGGGGGGGGFHGGGGGFHGGGGGHGGGGHGGR
jgi:hypothetical protein